MTWAVPSVIPLPQDFTEFDPASSIPCDTFSSYTRHLPHWRLPHAAYFVTFRLADSIPRAILAEIQREAEEWRKKGPLSDLEQEEWREFQRGRLRKLERLLDDGHGECMLRESRHRQAVVEALHHFEGERTEMLAYAVMPNHVHVLCRLRGGFELEKVCRSWKSFTGRNLQHHLGRKGTLWQDENFDRIIRDEAHYQATVRYIAKNPLKAGLLDHEAAVWFCQSIQDANPQMP